MGGPYWDQHYLISLLMTEMKGLNAPIGSLQMTTKLSAVVDTLEDQNAFQRDLDKLEKRPIGNS